MFITWLLASRGEPWYRPTSSLTRHYHREILNRFHPVGVYVIFNFERMTFLDNTIILFHKIKTYGKILRILVGFFFFFENDQIRKQIVSRCLRKRWFHVKHYVTIYTRFQCRGSRCTYASLYAYGIIYPCCVYVYGDIHKQPYGIPMARFQIFKYPFLLDKWFSLSFISNGKGRCLLSFQTNII